MPAKTKATRKPPSKRADDPEEYKRFLETAREVGASTDPKDFDRVFKKVVLQTRGTAKPSDRG